MNFLNSQCDDGEMEGKNLAELDNSNIFIL